LEGSVRNLFEKARLQPRRPGPKTMRALAPEGTGPDTDHHAKNQTRKGKTMTNKNAWIATLASTLAIATLLLFVASPSLKANDASATATVTIDNFVFGPQTITVPVGATVTWTNRDDIPHTSVSTDGVFKSKVLDTDEKFSYTFTKAGTYSYYCTIHPKMTGKVVVE
jgi:plastocyanin